MNGFFGAGPSYDRLRDLSLGQLRSLRARSDRKGTRIPPLRRQERRVAPPLSFAQERLWFLDQLGLVGAAYNAPISVRLEGSLDVLALERSFTELIRRHEILRTHFTAMSGVPAQIVGEPAPFPLRITDLTSHPEEVQAQLVKQLSNDETQRPFCLQSGLMLRASLVRLAPRQHLLLLTMHHIIVDGWSLGVLIRELGALYAGYVRGESGALPELSVQYGDYAIWQRNWLQGEVLEGQLQYWRDQLQGAPPQLQLPTDRPRPAVESFRGARLNFELPAGLSEALKELARREGATLFMVFLAVYQLLLSRWSGQEDIVVGSPIAGRQHRELEGLIGFFVNTLVLRTDVSGDLTFRQLLERVKEVTLGAYAHQDLPFEALVKALRPERNLTRQPVFQVTLALQNYPEERLELPGLTWTWNSAERTNALFDLSLFLVETAGGMSGAFEYATDLFDAETIGRMSGHFRRLLEAVVSAPDELVRELPLLSEAEKQQVTVEWNAAPAAYPERCVHDLFAEQAQRTPEVLAVSYGEEALTYAELNRRADQLARYLRQMGVGAEQRVAICTERSVEMVVGILGVLKAGGAYVPLDPAYPVERLEFMLKDAAPRVLLTQQHLKGRLPEMTAAAVALDQDWAEIVGAAARSADPAIAAVRPDNLAYVIYTSGSTGQPRGVMIEHRNVVSLWQALEHIYRQSQGCERIALNASINFDGSVKQLIQLLSGRAVFPVPQECREDAAKLLSFVEQNTIDGIDCTPLQLRSWISAGLFRNRSHCLRMALVGGEAIDAELWSELRQCRETDFYNVYGPTESTVDATSAPLKCDTTAPHIGRPLENRRICILDRHGKPVPVGVAGEIYIGGAGVARGYLNQPELTAQRFLPDPFSADTQARLYRTGDLGKWRANGTIEYLGRNDYQVKIRGYRIELGEIEAQLIQHVQVKEAVVVAREDVPGERRVVAYVVGEHSTAAEGNSSEATTQKLRGEAVGEWEMVHEGTYATRNHAAGPSFVGWDSSYTGQAIPQEQMQEWLTCVVERICALKPCKVLEIGCGVGLVLQHVAPGCEVYVGTDFSASAVEQLRSWVSGRKDLSHVQLLHRSATQLQDFESGSFDTIVLNSVVQYFPDVEYLLAVLQEAVRLVGPEGKIFIGDVRHLGLLPMFHSAVQLSKASATVSVKQLRKRIARAMAQEKELVLDPQFFHALAGALPGIREAQVQLKRGSAPNELTRYRYDVVLYAGDERQAAAVFEPLPWQSAVGSVDALETALQERRWRAVCLQGIPNARLVKEQAAQKLIESGDEQLEASVMRRQLSGVQSEEAADPQRLWELGEMYGYDVRVSCSAQMPECFEVQLLDRSCCDEVPREVAPSPEAVRPWSAYANDPLENGFRQQLIPQLREYLKGRLPEYMIPSAWVALKELPVTPNGKVDRRALPAPQGRPEEMGEYVAPSTELERTLAQIWAEVLRVDQVGIHDNFFELGGHSLSAVKLVARIEELLQIRLSVIKVFQFPTVQALSELVASLGPINQESSTPGGLELSEGVL